MRLISLRLHGYKRFKEPSELIVRGKLVAIVGPNEAGKTSVLRALRHLASDGPFTDKDGIQELSRDVELGGSHEVIAATFLLSAEEQRAIAQEFDGHLVADFQLVKSASGKRSVHLGERSRFITEELVAFRLKKLRGFCAQFPDRQFEQEALEVLDEAIPYIGDLQQLRRRWPQEESHDSAQALRELDELIATLEEGRKVEAKIEKALLTRIPDFRLFEEEDRGLRSAYTITQRVQNRDEDFPQANRALFNLLDAVGADRGELAQAVRKGDQGKVAAWTETAEARLTDLLQEGWPTPGMRVRLRVNGSTLHILVGPERDYTPITERSEGMRIFAALSTFTRVNREGRAQVLLIDEAEQHLHYDAQAQLVQVLAQQTAVSQVVYTTHSAGCLPEDLGMSVRAVQPLPDNYSSRIVNNIWGRGTLGFSTLHLAMGASSFAFGATRRAVFVEGVTDSALLPTLFKEATGHEQLGFQLVPGLSGLRLAELQHLAAEAPQFACLVDGDAGGEKLQQDLLDAGVSEDQILALPTGLVLEDLIDLKVYWRAVLGALGQPNAVSSPPSALRGANRPKRLEQWCTKNNHVPPMKTAVGHELMALALSGERLLSDVHRDFLVRQYEAISTLFAGSAQPAQHLTAVSGLRG